MNKERETPVRIIYRKKRGAHGHHGGSWKVAFADFMTAMFALFLVLWLVNQSSDVKSAIAGYFQDPLGRADEYGSSILPGEGAQTSAPRVMDPEQVLDLRRDRLNVAARQLQQKLADQPDLSSLKSHIDIQLTDEGLRILLMEDSTGVFFETGNARPTAAGEHILELLGSELGKLPNLVRIEGHTDARPYRDPRGYGNWELSTDRANLARRILTGNGLADIQVSEVRGLADRQLRLRDDPFAAGNRRIAITVLLDRPGARARTDPAAAADSIALHRRAT